MLLGLGKFPSFAFFIPSLPPRIMLNSNQESTNDKSIYWLYFMCKQIICSGQTELNFRHFSKMHKILMKAPPKNAFRNIHGPRSVRHRKMLQLE